jgi:hypothetical protein
MEPDRNFEPCLIWFKEAALSLLISIALTAVFAAAALTV